MMWNLQTIMRTLTMYLQQMELGSMSRHQVQFGSTQVKLTLDNMYIVY